MGYPKKKFWTLCLGMGQREAKRMQKKSNELKKAIVLVKTYSVTRPANVAETQLPPHQSNKSKPTPKREMLKSKDKKRHKLQT